MLVLLGDRGELVSVEEAAEMFLLLPHGELAGVPGADHGAFFSTTVDTFQSLILSFCCGARTRVVKDRTERDIPKSPHGAIGPHLMWSGSLAKGAA